MSNSVTTAIRGSLRETEIGRSRNTDKADRGHLYIIDVSQSVDLDHPLALNFLREDCDHVSVHRKVIERGDISVEDEIADSVFMKVALPKFDEQQIKVDVNDKIKEEEDESESGSDEELGREDKKAARKEHKKKRESLRRTRHPNLSRREKKISKPHKTR
ncbi:hypothetical protein Bca52824_078368 [Brassica carinata]|uniref:non-specific serine/threonine protein kinase n=1 Tax=Brassica carinata TaxID=52824 RepID=A0A8X7Q0T9_BRACI|nr:hypothetical protein Bca52824_078368 [Brassica carinata]